VRNLFLFALLVAAGYWYAHHNVGLDHASDLAGTWTQEFMREGASGNMTLHLDADGQASLRLDFLQQGLRVSRDVPGHWQCAQNQFTFSFDPGAAPEFLTSKRFGGRIVTLDDRQLQFKSPTAIESWSRVP
jgi:hypothetical protein